jgi:hypothetical protein
MQRRQPLQEPIDIAAVLLSLGSLYEKACHHEKALECFTEAHALYNSSASTSAVDKGVALTNIGWVQYLQETLKKRFVFISPRLFCLSRLARIATWPLLEAKLEWYTPTKGSTFELQKF